MKIISFSIRNFRTLEHVNLEFPSSYAAICGPNDCGKTNVVRAIRAVMKDESVFHRAISFSEDTFDVSLKDDFPKWKDVPLADRQIELVLTVEVQRERDTGFHQFLTKQLSLENPTDTLIVVLTLRHGAEKSEPDIAVKCAGREYDGLDAQQVLRKLQTSRSVLFHNSTRVDPEFPFPSPLRGVIRAETAEQEAVVEKMHNAVSKGLKKISRTHQKEIEDLLGRLDKKYSVGLSMPAFDFSSVPFSMTLGQKKFEHPLEDWGSGTKNRTLILMTLFRAKQLSESEASAGKITPVIVIEEPESFLHPAAQAEFGRILHDLAEEFEIQVIATTHSPYLLSLNNPQSNILLDRRIRYKQQLETQRVDTSGDKWMEPFGLALGLASSEVGPWKGLLLAASDAILLVEGETDREYFEMLRHEDHGANRLAFEGEIVSYDGTGSLSNTVLLRFVKNRYARIFVTFDLDAESVVAKSLTALGLEKKKHFLPIGVNAAGKKNIEGLLPEAVRTSVYSENPDLVAAATSGTKKEQESAKSSLKARLLEKFKADARPGAEHYGGFYPVVKTINKALT